ncbi:MAG: AAA family ATPase [Dehalococcoidales bacterium]|nr:AAA family ATPase [Dehalococcoidales bacterium]
MPKGFERATTNSVRRLIARIGGLEKCGKTHFALTAPAPIGLLDMDRGLEGVVEKFAGDKEIYTTNFRSMPSRNQADWERRWGRFKECFHTLLGDSTIRTVVMDTDTEAWEMARLAILGKLTQVKPHHYGTVNAEFRELIDAAFSTDKNLILICKYKKQYVDRSGGKSDDAKWNGHYEASGFNDLPFLVQVNLRARMYSVEGENTPVIEVVNCRHNLAVKGEKFEDIMASFPFVASAVIEGTDVSDWE